MEESWKKSRQGHGQKHDWWTKGCRRGGGRGVGVTGWRAQRRALDGISTGFYTTCWQINLNKVNLKKKKTMIEWQVLQGGLIRLKQPAYNLLKTPRLRNSNGNLLGFPPSSGPFYCRSINFALLPTTLGLAYLFILPSHITKNHGHYRKRNSETFLNRLFFFFF